MLAVVRHGETLSYRDGGLTAAGRDQAAEAAERVAALGHRAAAVYSSPSRRCRETARLVAAGLVRRGVGVERVAVTEALAPVRLFVDGRSFDLGAARDRPAAAASEEVGRFWAELSGGGDPFRSWEEGAYRSFEPPEAVRRRLLDFLEACPPVAVAVTHGEICRLLLGLHELAGTIPAPGTVLVVAGTPTPQRR